jgi:MoxR-like ATPase
LPYADGRPPEPLERQRFSIDDVLRELFLEREEVERILAIWRAKKNLILQGPPGVGKSFAARRLAFSLTGFRDPALIEFVQFHQSYSYEDFIQGYRPTENGFALRDGRFLDFCRRAATAPDVRHVFIIDEINRGNLSKIFGELMLLIEADKRGPNWQLPLAYARQGEQFYVPENVYLLGLMNTADRSLAVVDYALRRRFAFVDLIPRFETEKFAQYMEANGISDKVVHLIRQRVGTLNRKIEEDRTNLGRGFAIGHSFFCISRENSVEETAWYRQIIETEIVPLLEEYWFDSPSRVAEMRDSLLAGV